MNGILQNLAARKSVRVFTDAPITSETKQAVLQAAFEAPTAGCQQLYTILDITDPALKAQMADLCDHQPFIATAPLVLVFLADCSRWLGVYQAAGCTPRNPGTGDLLLAVADACIAAQNTVVAAESLGLGSCYIGDVLENCAEMQQALNLPDYVVPAAMLVYGYPTPQQAARPKPQRFSQKYIVSENTYPAFSAAHHRAAFDEWAARKEAATLAQNPCANPQPFNFDAWVTAFCNRKYQSDFSREMTRSANEYLAQFGLCEKQETEQ